MESLCRFLKFLVFVLVLLTIAAVSVNLFIARDTVVPPHIEPRKTNVPLPAPEYTFSFEKTVITVTSPVDPSVYIGAKAADKETIVRGNVSEDILIRRTYLAMIDDPGQDRFFNDLIRDLRSIRDKYGLDDDEYLELATVLVQSIRYETIGENPPKFPVETFVDGSGDCDDKSLLLAGILSREGYNVSLLSFAPESHMAVGIVCPGGEYQHTGYAFIETTNLSFVGVPTEILAGGIPLRSSPLVIPVGNGTKTYGSCGETLYLNSVYTSSVQEVKDLTARIDSLKTEMDGYYAKRDVNNYNLRVPLYNDLQHKRLQYAELHNLILDHRYDRKGTYTYVKNNMPV